MNCEISRFERIKRDVEWQIERREERISLSFNPIDYGFRWTEDWYEFDKDEAVAMAKEDRKKIAKILRDAGYKTKMSTRANQTMKKGGIGTDKPEIDVNVTVYKLEAKMDED